MGTKSKTMHGARAQLSIAGKIVGVFNSVSYGIQYDANPVYVLGRFNAAEIALTGMEPVSVTAQGFRVVENGPYVVSNVPMLQELLNHEDIILSLFDRQSGKEIMTVVGVRPTGYTTDVAARGLQSLSVSFMGLSLSDEAGDQDEEKSATNY
jgi:hypothetical protein